MFLQTPHARGSLIAYEIWGAINFLAFRRKPCFLKTCTVTAGILSCLNTWMVTSSDNQFASEGFGVRMIFARQWIHRMHHFMHRWNPIASDSNWFSCTPWRNAEIDKPLWKPAWKSFLQCSKEPHCKKVNLIAAGRSELPFDLLRCRSLLVRVNRWTPIRIWARSFFDNNVKKCVSPQPAL